MDKRYQVFVSSTYQDLQEERQAVMQALLELDCIPSGMELFPAADADQWTLIKRVIDDCDYYLVIIGGRYGSVGPDGISYTEMEYRYARETGKPIIAFLHRDPGQLPANRTEIDAAGRERLKTFRELAEQKVVKYWNQPADLGSVVSRSIIMLIRTTPAIGWVRANQVPDDNLAQEALRLRKQVEELETKLRASRIEAPEGTEELAQGDDAVKIHYSFVSRNDRLQRQEYSCSFRSTWNSVFSHIAPLMIDEVSDSELREALNDFVATEQSERLQSQRNLRNKDLGNFRIEEADFQTVKVQLRSLGLMTRSQRPRSVKDTSTYWTLTPYGDNTMTVLRAVKRNRK